MLPGISKPLFVTGSQLPLFYQQGSNYPLLFNTDALRNVLGAIQFMTFGIPEVGLYFADTLMRGNRVVKSNASQFTAFSSPNYPALGTYGVVPVLNDSLILPTPSVNSLDNNIQKVSANLAAIAQNINQNSVIQFLLFPAYYNSTTGASLLVSMLSQLQSASPQVKGIIFESFGSGNIPDFAQMQTLLQGFNNKGTIMVDCTQVYSGEVNYNIYATGAWLKGAGVIGSYDMIPTAALTKLVVLLALNPTQVRTLMATNLAGEITSFYALSGYQNEFLVPGESLFSINGNYQFTNEATGTLALYDISGTTPKLIWSQVNGAQGRLVMQADCNLVFYNKDFKPLWSTNTQRIGTNAVFQVNSNGSLSINDLYTGALIYQIYSPTQIALAS